MSKVRVSQETIIKHDDDRDLLLVVDDGYIKFVDCDKVISELECVTLKSALALHEMLSVAIKEIEGHVRYAQFKRERGAA